MAQQFAIDGESLITPDQFGRAVRAISRDSSSDLLLAKAELALVLELSFGQFQAGVEPHVIVENLTRALHRLRRQSRSDVWSEVVMDAQVHRVAKLLHEDPLTRWSFEKPRGYSGDAHLLDFIYGSGDIAHAVGTASAMGRAIYNHTKNASSSVAVRERRDILARRVDDISVKNPEAVEVLSIASGHLREAGISAALKAGAIKRWVALDQDPISIGTVARDFMGTAVEAVNGSVKSLLANRHALHTFDFVYAAGLYDYLPESVAMKLTRKCLDMLKPGGTFLFANFSEETTVDGYMETFMNWPLLLRSEREMWAIANGSVRGDGFGVKVWFGGNRDIVYCEIEKPRA
jgi:SAM-dependent methyltransferase